MSWGFVAVGVGTAITAYSNDQAGKAAGSAARAQMNAADRMRYDAMQQAGQAGDRIRSLADATPEELAMQSQGLGAVQAQLRSQQAMLAAIDPSIMEASQQALKLLRGGQAESMNPAMQQRQQQRESFLASLRAQLGPGAETTGFGQKQLQAFDQQTTLMMNQMQQGQLGNLTNIMGGMNSMRPDIAGTAQAGQSLASIFQNRKLNGEMNASGLMNSAMTGTSASVIENAGAPFVQRQLEARNMAQIGQTVSNFGGMFAGMNSGKATKKNGPNDNMSAMFDGSNSNYLSGNDRGPRQQLNVQDIA